MFPVEAAKHIVDSIFVVPNSSITFHLRLSPGWLVMAAWICPRAANQTLA